MATETTEKTLSKGVRVLKNLVFSFPDYASTDILKRKGNFTITSRNGVLGDDGVYREPIQGIDESGSVKLSQEQTKLLMADSVVLASGKELTGEELAEAIGIFVDRCWAGDFDKPIDETTEV